MLNEGIGFLEFVGVLLCEYVSVGAVAISYLAHDRLGTRKPENYNHYAKP